MGRGGQVSHHFHISQFLRKVLDKALGSLMCSRESDRRAHARWDGGCLICWGVGSDPSSAGWFGCSELWGCLEHLEALQKGLSGDLPAAVKGPECLGCSALVIVYLSPLCATSLGLLWGALWHLLSTLQCKYRKHCFYQGTARQCLFLWLLK